MTTETNVTTEQPVQQETVNPRDAFLQALPEEYRTDAVFGNFSNVADLAKSYKSAASLVGMDKNYVLALPKEDTPDAWSPVWDKLGRPESADKYEVVAPDGLQFDDNFVKSIKEVAHQNGVSAKAFKAITEAYGKMSAETLGKVSADSQSQIENWNLELKREFGEAFNDKIAIAQDAVKKFGGEEAQKFFAENPQFGNNPLFVKMFANIGSQIQGDKLPGETVGNSNGRLTPAEAQMEIKMMEADPEARKALFDNKHPMHKHYVERRARLFEAAHATAA